MQLTLTAEQRKAIDKSTGAPVYLVDAENKETFVLLREKDFRRIRPLGEEGNGAHEAEELIDWTEAKDERRYELIKKDIARKITPTEAEELAQLDLEAEKHFDRIAPLPMKGAQRLYRELLGRREKR